MSDELDLERLAPYLAGHGFEGPVTVERLAGGYSNLTYLVKVDQCELVLRRPPRGADIPSAHDMSREHRLLSALHPVYPRVPRPILLCQDAAVIGAPFFVMERVQGVILRGGGDERCVPELMRSLSIGLIDLLAELHELDYTAAGLADVGKPEGYVGRQIRGWCERWRKAETDPVPEVGPVMLWLERNQPADSLRASLIHNDFKYDNLVLDPDNLGSVRAVLDWEMATIGDPLMDLGTTLGYWVEADDPPAFKQLGFGPTFLPGNLTRAELVQRYAWRRNINLGEVVYYYVFGLFKIAVIAQQIFARYRKGLTADPRFAQLDQAVRLLLVQALRQRL